MFEGSEFNQNISNWSVFDVRNMRGMFQHSKFNKDISRWDVSRVKDFSHMFYGAHEFNQNLSDWVPKKLKSAEAIFKGTLLANNGTLPYWATVKIELLEQAINQYQLYKKLEQDLPASTHEKIHKSGVRKL